MEKAVDTQDISWMMSMRSREKVVEACAMRRAQA